MITALSGTTRERNTIISSTNETSSTPPKKSGSRSATPRVLSRLAATIPPTATVRSVPAMASGIAVSRSVSTRSSVASSWGEVVGTTVSTAVSPASLRTGAVTRATPSTAPSSVPTAWLEASSSRPEAPWTVTIIGAAKPGPKPSASRSYAWWVVEAGGSFWASGNPRRMPRRGAASARRTASPPIAANQGRRWTNRLHRYQRVVS